MEHVATGTDLFRVICEQDMEGIVAKQASAKYTPEATSWVKIKNRQYSQAVGREDFFDRRKAGEYVGATLELQSESGRRTDLNADRTVSGLQDPLKLGGTRPNCCTLG